jgi:hypothetical protein
MSPIGSLEDQMKMEVLRLQSEVLTDLADVMERYNLPKEAWIEVIFKRYMHLPDDIVNVFMVALPGEAQPAGESKKQPAPNTAKLIQEIGARLDANKIGLIRKLREAMSSGMAEERRPKKMSVSQILAGPQSVKEGDLVVSGFGQKNPLKPPMSPSGSDPQQLNEAEPAYRKYINVR